MIKPTGSNNLEVKANNTITKSQVSLGTALDMCIKALAKDSKNTFSCCCCKINNSWIKNLFNAMTQSNQGKKEQHTIRDTNERVDKMIKVYGNKNSENSNKKSSAKTVTI